jgi:hypothetical protein
MTRHQIGSVDPADEALAQRLSWNLLDAVRGVGLGRGLDLAAHPVHPVGHPPDPEHGPTRQGRSIRTGLLNP